MKVSRQFFVFCVVGSFGLLVDLLALYAVSPVLGWYGGRVASFLAAASFTWYLNRTITFANTEQLDPQPIWRQYTRYMAAMLGGAAVNFLVYVATLEFRAGPGMPALGVALGSIAGLIVNFASARYLVFRVLSQ